MRAKSIATLVIIKRGGSILLGEKKKGEIGSGKINAPGGKWEDDEGILDCARREVKEEVGISVGRLRHIGVLECFADKELFQLVHVYFTEEFTGTPVETESMLPRWTGIHAVPYNRMHQGDRFWFELAARGRKFRAKVWYKRPGEGYIDHELLPY